MNDRKMTLNKMVTATVCLYATHLVAQERPNIIVFLVDDMGVMDTSVLFLTDKEGTPQRYPLNDWYHTPNMERLAQQGIRFSNFYAQSVSSPSRSSIMTGQNAARHRITNWINATTNNRDQYGPMEWNWEGLTRQDNIYPAVLQEAGYRTIHVGKAHFGCQNSQGENPMNLGFDVNIGGSAIGHPGSYHGQKGYGAFTKNKSHAVPHLDSYYGTDTFLSDALTKEAGREIEKAVKEGMPFYLNLAHYAVHAPFETDERFIGRYANHGTKEPYAKAFATLVEGMDKSLGDLIDKLEELNVAENTLIIFLGDNGSDAPLGGAADYGSSTPLKGQKGSEYEGGVRVPFIVSWARPNADNIFQQAYPIAQNAVQTQMGTVMDIYPTVLSVAGLKTPQKHRLDGSDLKKLLQGKCDRRHRKDFLLHFPHQHRGSYFTTYTCNGWKLIYYYNPEQPEYPSCKLFNLQQDPYEKHDVAQQQPRKVRKLFAAMLKRLKQEDALYPQDRTGKELVPVLPEKYL